MVKFHINQSQALDENSVVAIDCINNQLIVGALVERLPVEHTTSIHIAELKLVSDSSSRLEIERSFDCRIASCLNHV